MIEFSKLGNVGIGAIAYAVFHYGAAAPEIASRIGKADHLAGCKQRYESVLRSEERKALGGIKHEGPSAADDMGAEYIRKLTCSPQGRIFRHLGYDRMLSLYE